MSDIRQEIFSGLVAVWRRRWIVLAITWGLCIIGWATVFTIPRRYESSAKIYVDTETLLGPLLRNILVENDPRSHAQMIQRTLLSRPNLRKVTMATDLAMTTRGPLDEANLYERLEKSTTISAQGTNLFSISFVDSNPVLARNVVQALITILVETNTGQKRGDMEEARGFIEKQIATYETDLRAIEKRMTDFRAAHLEELPSTSSSNFGERREQARLATATARNDLADAEARLDRVRTTLSKTPQYLDVDSAPQVIVTNQIDPAQQRIAEIQRNLDSLKSRYTDKHPEVIATQKMLEEAVQAAKRDADGKAADGTAAKRTAIPNKVYEQMQLRQIEEEQAVDISRRRLAHAQEEEARLATQAASAPAIEAQYNDLARGYGALKKQYEELLSRRETARLSEAAENTANKTQFRVVEPPSVPVKPAGPPRFILLCAVLIGSIGAGAGIILAFRQIEGPVTSLDTLKTRFPYNSIGEITVVHIPDGNTSRRRKDLFFVGAGAALLVVLGILITVSMTSNRPSANLSLDTPAEAQANVG